MPAQRCYKARYKSALGRSPGHRGAGAIIDFPAKRASRSGDPSPDADAGLALLYLSVFEWLSVSC